MVTGWMARVRQLAGRQGGGHHRMVPRIPGPMTSPGNDLLAAFRTALGVEPDVLARGVREGIVVAVCAPEEWRQHLALARTLAGEEGCARAGRQRDPRRGDGLVLVYALHRLLVAAALDLDPSEVPVGRDGRGCPTVPGRVLWTSLSHADAGAAYAVCAHGPVGVDLESCRRMQDMSSIRDRIVHPGDEVVLAGLPSAAEGRALLELWVRKEAVLKAAGIGLECEMDRFCVPGDGVVPLPGGDRAGSTTQVRLLDAGPERVVAVAGPPGLEVTFLDLHPPVRLPA